MFSSVCCCAAQVTLAATVNQLQLSMSSQAQPRPARYDYTQDVSFIAYDRLLRPGDGQTLNRQQRVVGGCSAMH
jgi:hypothetical protein